MLFSDSVAGSMFLIITSLLASCVMCGRFIDEHYSWEKNLPNTLYGWKYFDIGLTVAILSAVGAAVAIATLVLYILGLSNLIILILGAAAVALTFGTAVAEGMFYDTSVNAYELKQSLLPNRTANTDWALKLTKELWEHTIEFDKKRGEDEGDTLYQNIPKWDDELKKIKDHKHTFLSLWKTHRDSSITAGEAAAIKFSFSEGNFITAKITGRPESDPNHQLQIGLAYVHDTEDVPISYDVCWLPTTFSLKFPCEKMEIKYNYDSDFLNNYGNHDMYSFNSNRLQVPAYMIQGPYSNRAFVDSYQYEFPIAATLWSYDDFQKYTSENKIPDGVKNKITHNYPGWDLKGFRSYIKDKITEDLSPETHYFFCRSQPSSTEYTEFSNKDCSFLEYSEAMGGEGSFFNYPYSNVGVYDKEYWAKFRKYDTKPAIYIYREETSVESFESRQAQFGIAICIIQVCAIALWIGQLVMGFTCAKGSGKVSNEA